LLIFKEVYSRFIISYHISTILQLDFAELENEEAVLAILECRSKSTLDLFESKCDFGVELGPKFVVAKS